MEEFDPDPLGMWWHGVIVIDTVPQDRMYEGRQVDLSLRASCFTMHGWLRPFYARTKRTICGGI